MAIALEKLNSIRTKLKTAEARDMVHEELGTANGFHDANRCKESILSYVRALLEDLSNADSSINEIVVEEGLESMETALTGLIKASDNIEAILANGQGANNPDFPNQRNGVVATVRKLEKNLKKTLHTLELNIQLNKLNSLADKGQYFQAAEASVQEKLGSIQEMASNAEKILSLVKNKTIQRGVDDSASHFGELCRHHKLYENTWLVVFILLSITFTISVFNALDFSVEGEIGPAEYLLFLKRLVIVSIPSLFLRVALIKYNTERNLRIIYSHREKVLDQYKSFEAGIGDDSSAKNQFRLEIAKYIFSDPESGYIANTKNSATEININPITSIVEKLGGNK